MLVLMVNSIGGFAVSVDSDLTFIYGDGCGPCEQLDVNLISFLEFNGFDVDRVNIMDERYIGLAQDYKLEPRVPVVIVGDTVVEGYSEFNMERIFYLLVEGIDISKQEGEMEPLVGGSVKKESDIYNNPFVAFMILVGSVGIGGYKVYLQNRIKTLEESSKLV